MTVYRDVQTAFIEELRCVLESGENVEVRGNSTRELRARLIEISDIRSRQVIATNRHNNIFASIAESMWVICGRNDMEYLGAYLKRASEFSDDGTTWRAGYGPRIRNWNGIDQLSEVVRILRADPLSRRAVISIYDPDRDFVESLDVPCNNWLHFLVRDGKLHLHVAARSTDIWWGFSGINAFEWTLLLEMMSRWLDYEPGRLVFFSSSMHLYERHFDRAESVVNANHETVDRRPGGVRAFFDTEWKESAGELQEWMRLENRLRSGERLVDLEPSLTDPLLLAFIRMIELFWSAQNGVERSVLNQLVQGVGDHDLEAAAVEFLGRSRHGAH